MALTIGIGVILLVLGIVGWRRGLPKGLLTLIGILIGAALVDLWYEPLTRWLVILLKEDRPVIWTWAIISLVFLGVVLIVGYGSGMLLPRQRIPEEEQPHGQWQGQGQKQKQGRGIGDSIMGALVGMLSGAMIVSYLLRYATTILDNEELETVIHGSPPAAILQAWLPWFVLAIVATLSLAVMLRGTYGVAKMTILSSGKQARPQEKDEPATIAGAGSSSNRMDAVSNKIDQALRDGEK
jgi:MFS family permease